MACAQLRQQTSPILKTLSKTESHFVLTTTVVKQTVLHVYFRHLSSTTFQTQQSLTIICSSKLTTFLTWLTKTGHMLSLFSTAVSFHTIHWTNVFPYQQWRHAQLRPFSAFEQLLETKIPQNMHLNAYSDLPKCAPIWEWLPALSFRKVNPKRTMSWLTGWLWSI